jgi:hypothetical protein
VRYACSGAIARSDEGRGEPASPDLSPVARDYPSLRFRQVFQATVRLTVLSRNSGKPDRERDLSHDFVLHKIFTGKGLVHIL